MTERLWTVDDVAAYLGVPKQTLYQWRTRGYVPAAAGLASTSATTPTMSSPGWTAASRLPNGSRLGV